MTRRTFSVLVAVCVLAPVGLSAQASRATPPDIPAEYRPPPGMCRIWVEGVPPNKQPAPTDCTKALRNKPSNAQVIFGDTKDAPKAAGANVAPPRANLTNPVPTSGRGNARPTRPDSAKASRDTTKAKRDTVPPKRDTIPAQRARGR